MTSPVVPTFGAALLESVNAPIIAMDRKGCIMHWNRPSAAITGFSQREVRGAHFKDFVSPEYRVLVRKLIHDLCGPHAIKSVPNLELTLLTKTGGCVDVVLNATQWHGTGEGRQHVRPDHPNDGSINTGGPRLLGLVGVAHVQNAHFAQKYRLLANNAQEIFKWMKGNGSFGCVFLARRLGDNRLVAIKKLNLAGQSKRAKENVEKEAYVLKSIQHPNIVSCFDSFVENKEFYIVMEYIDGGNLRQHVQRQAALPGSPPFPTSTIISWFSQLVAAVHHIHQRNIIHRDIKSLNIMLCTDQTVKLGDFGHAKEINNDRGMNTACGTPETMAPEVVLGRFYNQQADMWAVGCVLYELMMLRRPFDGPTLHDLLMKVCCVQYEPMPESTHSDLRLMTELLLTETPEGRPSINEVADYPLVKEAIEQQKKGQRQPSVRRLSNMMGQNFSRQRSLRADLLLGSTGVAQGSNLAPSRDGLNVEGVNEVKSLKRPKSSYRAKSEWMQHN